MKKFLTAVGMTGLMMMSAVPASAAPSPELIESVVIHDGTTQGATNACDGLRNSKGKNREVQLERHGCVTQVSPEPDPVISDG